MRDGSDFNQFSTLETKIVLIYGILQVSSLQRPVLGAVSSFQAALPGAGAPTRNAARSTGLGTLSVLFITSICCMCHWGQQWP